MCTTHTIMIGNINQMNELADSSIDLMVTSPPYLMIKMWDNQFSSLNPKITKLWKNLLITKKEETLHKIFQIMHDSLGKTWRETFSVLREGGIACINIGDATRKINESFRLFSNHSKIIECCEKIGFTTLPYILWKKPTTKPQYRGKMFFWDQDFLLQMPI